ncbi:hypothetical protein [Numidum massiliense]|uniref:hypothetical protein n=1 Tax=Numidum massiliense TaxID=1522315 RepID=UPI0006D55396|nr:hypothetical protein [Numidum massiliense]
MNLFTDLSSKFSVDAKQPPCTGKEIADLKRFSSIVVPTDYFDIVRQATEVEINVDNKKYIRIWGPLGCIEMNKAYNIQEFIPESLAIGDDEGGGVLMYLNGSRGFGLYITDFGNLDVDDAVMIAPNLHSLFVENIGVDRFLDY